MGIKIMAFSAQELFADFWGLVQHFKQRLQRVFASQDAPLFPEAIRYSQGPKVGFRLISGPRMYAFKRILRQMRTFFLVISFSKSSLVIVSSSCSNAVKKGILPPSWQRIQFSRLVILAYMASSPSLIRSSFRRTLNRNFYIPSRNLNDTAMQAMASIHSRYLRSYCLGMQKYGRDWHLSKIVMAKQKQLLVIEGTLDLRNVIQETILVLSSFRLSSFLSFQVPDIKQIFYHLQLLHCFTHPPDYQTLYPENTLHQCPKIEQQWQGCNGIAIHQQKL